MRLANELRARPGVLPLGVRDGGRRLASRHQPVRPARRAGGEGQDPADPRLRRGSASGTRSGSADELFAQAQPGDYVAILAFVNPTAENAQTGAARAASSASDRLRGHARVRAALPALHRAAAQGRPADRAASCRSSTTPATRSRSRTSRSGSASSSARRRPGTSRRCKSAAAGSRASVSRRSRCSSA